MPKGRAWTASEIEQLEEMAGHLPLSHIAKVLHRSEMSVRHVAMRHEIELRYELRGFVMCPACHSWRSSLRLDGNCRICAKRESANRYREECEQILAALSPERQASYKGASSRSSGRKKPLPPRPVQERTSGMSKKEQRQEYQRYLKAVEAWEYACAMREYNREKRRCMRLRKIASEDMEIL